MFEVSEAVELYKKYAKIPAISGGKILSVREETLNISCEWSLRNLEESSKTKFLVNSAVFASAEEAKLLTEFPSVDISTESVSSISPSGRKRLVLRSVKDEENKDKQYLEIWDNGTKIHNINVEEKEIHGKIHKEEQFRSFDWSADEKFIIYTAEKFQPKSKSFLKKTSNSKEDEKTIYGEEYFYKEDWGEQLTGKCSPIPCIFDAVSGNIKVLDFLPNNVSFGQSTWGPNGDVITVGWFHESEKLGVIYCSNRRSAIFHVFPTKQEYEIIGSQDNAVQLLMVSPQKTKLVYFENKILGPHKQCCKVKMFDWNSLSIVVEQVRVPSEDGFPGLYPVKWYFLDENNVIISSVWRSTSVLLSVNLPTGKVIRLTNDPKIGSWNLLDVKMNYILASASSLDIIPHLVIGVIKDYEEMDVVWHHLSDGPQHVNLDLSWTILSFKPEHGNTSLEYEAIYVEPSSHEGNLPLVVWPHGGPHSATLPSFNLFVTLFTKIGYSVLLVNYRGSTGFGQDSIDSLLGNIGDQDVKDVQQAVLGVISTNSINEEKICLFGGSHGGFLVTHLIGQYPNFYSSCVSRNPVIELSSLADVSDIPDWSWVESGIGDDVTERSLITPRIREIMWEKSPMRYVDYVKTPILFLIGSEDRRVPSSQAMKYYKALKARNIETKILMYKDNHPLSKVAVEADGFFNTMIWFDRIQK